MSVHDRVGRPLLELHPAESDLLAYEAQSLGMDGLHVGGVGEEVVPQCERAPRVDGLHHQDTASEAASRAPGCISRSISEMSRCSTT